MPASFNKGRYSPQDAIVKYRLYLPNIRNPKIFKNYFCAKNVSLIHGVSSQNVLSNDCIWTLPSSAANVICRPGRSSWESLPRISLSSSSRSSNVQNTLSPKMLLQDRNVGLRTNAPLGQPEIPSRVTCIPTYISFLYSRRLHGDRNVILS